MAETRVSRAASLRRRKSYQLEQYRVSRRAVALRAMRMEAATAEEQRAVGFHAIALAELVDEEVGHG